MSAQATQSIRVSNQQIIKRPPIIALLIDISGNLHVGATPTPNAVESFHRLCQSSVPFRLCSNNSKGSTAALVKKLDAMGFGISDVPAGADGSGSHNKVSPPNKVWSSVGAVAQVLKDMGLKRPLLMLSDSAREEVLSAIRNPEEHVGDVPRDTTYDSVVVGLSPRHFDYANLNAAFRILKGETPGTEPLALAAGGDRCADNGSRKEPTFLPRIPLIATHKAKFVQTESGLSLGPGPFVTALESAANITAHVVGKPTKAFFQAVIQDFTAEELAAGPFANASDIKGRIAVIGDDVEADLGEGAIELGLWRILVKTGKYRAGDESRPGIVPPDEVFDSFAAIVESLLSSINDSSH